MHICVSNLNIIGPDNGVSPGRRQAIIWTNAGILLIGPLGTNFSEILIEIHTFSFKKMHFKLSSGKWRPFCLGLNVLGSVMHICITQIMTSHLFAYCWLIVDWTLGNKLQWNFNQNTIIFIEENAFANVHCEMVAILLRAHIVKRSFFFQLESFLN